MALFDITVSTKHGSVTLYGLSLGAVGERAAAVATQLECGFLPEQGGALEPGELSAFAIKRLEKARAQVIDAVTSSSGPIIAVVPSSIEDIASTQVANAFVGTDVLTHNAIPDVSPLYAATVDGVQEIVPPWRRTPPAKAIYTNAQFDKVCGERNVEDGTRCASLKKHRGVHAWRMVSDGAQPQPANNLEASTG